jgi:hypothetical protein
VLQMKSLVMCKDGMCENMMCKDGMCENMMCKDGMCENMMCKDGMCENMMCKELMFKDYSLLAALACVAHTFLTLIAHIYFFCSAYEIMIKIITTLL